MVRCKRVGSLLPHLIARRIDLRQVEAQIKFVLVVVGFHVTTQLVEGFVVLLFFQMRQLVYDDHFEKFFRHLLEQAGDADLVFGLELAALHA